MTGPACRNREPDVRLLFVCSRNRLRSPTAERIFAVIPGVECESAGVAPDAENPLTPELIEWAELVLVMESAHRAKVTRVFPTALRNKRVVSLDIPDEYEFMDSELIPLLWERVSRFVPAVQTARAR